LASLSFYPQPKAVDCSCALWIIWSKPQNLLKSAKSREKLAFGGHILWANSLFWVTGVPLQGKVAVDRIEKTPAVTGEQR
jgi:hypothetical protein